MTQAGRERGSIALIGLLILGVVSFFGMAAFVIHEKEVETTRLFLNAVPLQMEAQNGILAAVEAINGNAATREKIRQAAGAAVEIFQMQNPAGGMVCTVYAKQKADRILLLAVSAQGDGRSRAVAHLVKREGRWSIEHWEH